MDKYLKINNSDLTVCRIGFGTSQAGLPWDGAAARGILDGYIGLGGNLIDTARIYSDWVPPEIGRSERVLGDWIRHRGKHSDIILLTKCGHPRLNSMHTSRMSREEIESDLEKSLKSLCVECIDIFCYHRDGINRPVEYLIETMENFVRAGKIRYYGCSNWSAARMAEADAYCKQAGYRGFIINEALFNYGTKYMKPHSDDTLAVADDSMLKYHARTHDNVLVPYTSLCGGFFHTLDSKGEEAVKDSPYYTTGNLERYKKLKIIAKRHSTGFTQALLGFVLTKKTAMIPLMSSGSVKHIEYAMDTLNIDFCADEFKDESAPGDI
ncbi:MAG: aldo/keto reductase [Clostridiales bacterium]|jgi:aryl-alcohol dehydrogenase-like predicted oxidoreductase|nr:aldo/keto reductase [Clostridiales bacterium]